MSRDANGRYLDAVSFFHPDEKRALLAPDVAVALDGTAGTARASLRPVRRARTAGRMMRVDFETYLPEDI